MTELGVAPSSGDVDLRPNDGKISERTALFGGDSRSLKVDVVKRRFDGKLTGGSIITNTGTVLRKAGRDD
jgi:hypothetical protein